MKKILFGLMALGLAVSYAMAHDHEGMESKNKGKEVTVTGILVDTNCYLKDGHTNDDHDTMKACGRDCLRDGIPAGVLAGKKLYILVFPANVFSNYAGKTVEITGDLLEGNLLLPEKAFVIEKKEKKAIKLAGKVMM